IIMYVSSTFSFFLLIPPPPLSTLFPYTTLFRSAVGVQRAGSAVSRLTLAADAGGQCWLVLSVVAGIAPVLMGEMGAGARSRPARRRPELTACAAAPVRAAASSSSGQGLCCAVAHARRHPCGLLV